MSGVFCLLVPDDRQDGARIWDRLAGLMPVFPHQSVRRMEVVPSRLWLGAVANVPDPAVATPWLVREGDLVCAFEGHLVRSLAQVGAEALIAAGAHAAAVLAAYRNCGADCAARLEGQFNFVLADLQADRLLIADSRHGHSPLYIHDDPQGGSLLAASRLGPLAACGLFTPRLDLEAVGDFLAYGQLIGQDTYLHDVRVLDSATVIEVGLGPGTHRQRRRYWDFDSIELSSPDQPLSEHVREVCDALNAATGRILGRPGRCITGLSGGLDSRLVAGLAARHGRLEAAWTFGTDDAPDVRVAAQISRMLGIPHLVYPLAIEQVPEQAQKLVDAVDGSLTVEFAHGLVRAEDLRRQADFVLNGYAGEVFVRGSMVSLGRLAWKDYLAYRLGRGPEASHPDLDIHADVPQIAAFIAASFGRPGKVAKFLATAPRSMRAMVQQQFERIPQVPRPLLAERFILEDRGRRRTMMGTVMDRHFYGDASHFFDYELHDRCLAVHPVHRHHHRLFIPLMKELLPDLAQLPCGNTGLPAVASPRRVMLGKVWRQISGGGRKSGLSTGVRTDAAARTVLGGFYADLLADGRARSRPFWDGDALAGQATAYCEGRPSLGDELGRVAALELFLRRWIDPAAG